MGVQISVEMTFDDGTKRTHRFGRVSRPYRLTLPAALGLLLEDAKVILRQVQEALPSGQVEEVWAESRACPSCGSGRAVHDYRTRIFDTSFGRFRLRAPRFRQCNCDSLATGNRGRTLSPVTHFSPTHDARITSRSGRIRIAPLFSGSRTDH